MKYTKMTSGGEKEKILKRKQWKNSRRTRRNRRRKWEEKRHE